MREVREAVRGSEGSGRVPLPGEGPVGSEVCEADVKPVVTEGQGSFVQRGGLTSWSSVSAAAVVLSLEGSQMHEQIVCWASRVATTSP